MDPTLEAIRRISTALSITELASRFQQAVASLGMTASASGMVSGTRGTSSNIFHFTNWPSDWFDLYQRERFATIDPVPRWAIVSGEAVSWTSVVERLARADPGHAVYRAARQQGFHEGFVTPVRAQDGSLGLVSVGGGAREPFTLDEQHLLKALSTAALMRGEKILGYHDRIVASLTSRETEVVNLLRSGCTDTEIASALSLSNATVRFHLENARRKTGSRNRVDLAVGRIPA